MFFCQSAFDVCGFRPGCRAGQRIGAVAGAGALALFFALGTAGFAQDPSPSSPGQQGYPADPAADPAGQASAPASGEAADPPARVLRLSILNGDVSAEPAGVDTFSPAELNQVFTSGDRIYTDSSAMAELQTGQVSLRLGGGTDLTVTALTDKLAQFGLAAGSAHLRSFAIDPGTVLEFDTPEAAVTVLQPGDLRVDEDPNTHATTVGVLTGEVQVDSPGSSQVLTPGQRIRIHGADPATGDAAYIESLPSGVSDALDDFSASRDNQYASGSDAESLYLNANTIGGADLADSGSWDSSEYGPIWYPVVAVDWEPYCHGHWRWTRPWGWTWVENEPWGFAPFHYGRWLFIQGRWGWIPGPHVVHPVFAPALVAFAGGPEFSASLGYAPGLGVTAWFPLGPREPYMPWYYGSTLYRNRVNASNIYDPNGAQVRAFYNQRAVNVFNAGPPAARTYMNRGVGTVAVPEASFAAGHPVENARLRIPRETLASAPVLSRPLVAPDRRMEATGTTRSPAPGTSRAPLGEHLPTPERARAPEGIPGPEGTARRPEGTMERQPGIPTMMHRAGPPGAERPGLEPERRPAPGVVPERPFRSAPAQIEREPRPVGSAPMREAAPRPLPPAPPPPARTAPPPAAHREPPPAAAPARPH